MPSKTLASLEVIDGPVSLLSLSLSLSLLIDRSLLPLIGGIIKPSSDRFLTDNCILILNKTDFRSGIRDNSCKKRTYSV